MHRGSLDKNHVEVKAAFLALGCTVADMALAGVPGFPDLVVGCIGVNHLVEVKNEATDYGQRGLNKAQTRFNNEWRGECMFVAHNTDDAIALVSTWRAPAKART